MDSKYFLPFMLIFFLACSGPKTNTEKTEQSSIFPIWLAGNWQVSTDRSLHEKWIVKSDSSMTGQGFHLGSGDTTFFEFLEIRQFADSLCYIATVPGQNEGEPIYFSFAETDSSGFTCKNPKHDFPQEIAYRKISPDSIAVSISGMENGEVRTIDLNMAKKF